METNLYPSMREVRRRVRETKKMFKIEITFQNGDVWLHHFLTKIEANAYILGIREMSHASFHKPEKIKIDGKEV